jgi:hypothetical protein
MNSRYWLPAALLAIAACGAHAQSAYYVSLTGDDINGTGMADAPWATLARAIRQPLQPGDTVNVAAGTYQLTQPVSISNLQGSASAPIVLRRDPAATGPTVLDGSLLNATGGNFVGAVSIANSSYVRIEGFEIANFHNTTSNPDTGFVPVGIFVTGAGTGIQLVSNDIHAIVTVETPPTSTDPGQLGQGDAHGIAVYGTNGTQSISQLLIDGNELHDLKLGTSEALVVNGNVENFTITNNLIHDNDNIGIDVIGGEGKSPANDLARTGIVSGNQIYNDSVTANPGNPTYQNQPYASNALYCDGCANVVFERNQVHDCDQGIEAAAENIGISSNHVTIRNNIIYNNNTSGLSIGGYGASASGCTPGRGGGCGTSDHVVIVNNTLYNNNKVGKNAEVSIQYRSDASNVFDNNVVYAGSANVWINGLDGTSLATFDSNLYFSQAGFVNGTSITWLGNATFVNFAAYQSTSGQDSASAVADPLFLNPAAASLVNLDLMAGSPALGAGSSTLGCDADHYCGAGGTSVYGDVDILGNARIAGGQISIGAYQQ